MTYERPQLSIVSQAHLAVLEQHTCTGGTKGPQTADDCVTDLTDGAYSIDE